MMLRICLLGLILISGMGIHAQVLPEGGGARAAALGQAYTSVRSDIWGGMFYNPASLVGIENPTVGLDAEQRFGLNTGRLAVALPWGEDRVQAAGLSFSTFGFENYSSYRISASYALQAFDAIQLGARVHYQGMNITGYTNGSAIIADFGFLARLNDELDLAGRIHNVNQARLRTNVGEDVLASSLAIGLGYHPNDKVFVGLDIEKNELADASLRIGVEYEIHPAITARVGTHTQPLGWSGGFRLHTGPLDLDFSGSFHERLGFTPQLSVSWAINGQSDE
ncbi:MAG: hypothetical protein AB8F95_01790 [Bacteroidia bacterium]